MTALNKRVIGASVSSKNVVIFSQADDIITVLWQIVSPVKVKSVCLKGSVANVKKHQHFMQLRY